MLVGRTAQLATTAVGRGLTRARSSSSFPFSSESLLTVLYTAHRHTGLKSCGLPPCSSPSHTYLLKIISCGRMVVGVVSMIYQLHLLAAISYCIYLVDAITWEMIDLAGSFFLPRTRIDDHLHG